MNLLVVTETGSAWPSGFVRAHIFKSHLADLGWNARFISRRSEYLTRLIDHPSQGLQRALRLGGGRIVAALNSAIAQYRVARIASLAKEMDCVFLQKVDSIALFDAVRALPKKRVVFDLNDALWLPHWKRFLNGQLERVLRESDAITCDNTYGLSFAQSRAQSTFLVPDPPQVESFDIERTRISPNPSKVRIGWVGSRNTASSLFAAYEAINEVVGAEPNCELRLIGTDLNNPALPRFEAANISCLPRYNHADMVREVLQMHIGLFPMFDVEESRARGVLKATVYMSGGAAVVADPVGQMAELIDHGTNGVLPKSKQEWMDALKHLIHDASLRQRLSANALHKMRAEFNLDACFASWTAALEGRG